ncbi:DUF2157 domain-containing protein [Nostoc punctiforme FACHB-252]|uniref:DUF2157 domain-containing protein n=1 Tax=Nostoc punctiforme FACHB-252 TaxID=1357509 RepID=A0ABR8H8C3_NOSPU|nr:DUF2157 domain-containing protein [Nostoc punctiforme]MBD2611632.1 DUF2157 domain-containing protein [Nostoc punctiforme FACHB-252]
MSSPLDRPLKIEIRLPSSHPHLLEGLETWLRLGLISDSQVRQLCREFLTCAVVLQPQTQVQTKVKFATSESVEQLSVAALQTTPPTPAQPNFISTMLQSLAAELSVRWLLFLGVFLVVVSSGVLAASQWEKFPAFGQYGVLFAYTLSFWGLSFWATRQNNLRLTAQTLVIVTVLLVPVNFWAMDSFGLWQNPLNWIIVAIACTTLSAITVLISKNQTIFADLHAAKLPVVNILALSYLHWGWQFKGFPLIAVYLGIIATTIATLIHHRHSHTENPGDRHNSSISFSATVIIYALIILLVRAIFIASVNVTQLGLAIGICGWLITWLAQQGREDEAVTLISPTLGEPQATSPPSPPFPSSPQLWERLGAILLFLGWLVAIIPDPWQAIAVSGLGLWFVGNRLQRYSFKVDLAAVFVIGLQIIWLCWRLIPDGLQKLAIATATTLTNSQTQPWALLGVVLFPYVIFMVALTDNLYRSQKRELARFGELLTLLLGTFLTTIAAVNPALRSLNLLFSTITLAVVSNRRSQLSAPLVYLTHIIGVFTFCAWINWFFPTLSREVWASILLAVMVTEWIFSLGNGMWRRSAWDIGLGLAAVSFLLLWMNAEASWYGIVDGRANWGVVWLVTPIALNGVANKTNVENRTINRYLSILAVAIAQLLTLQLPGIRLIGLAVAAGLMFVHTRYLRNEISALITEGFVLSFIGMLLWNGVPGLPRLAVAGWFVVGAIATFSLWLIRRVLRQRGNELALIYAAASDKWAIALCGYELLALTLHSILIYQGMANSGFLYLLATGIILVSIIYRSWQQPTNWAFYGIGWCLELLAAQALGFGSPSIIKIAIANIALGLLTQLVGEWWKRRHQLQSLPSSFHILPIVYGVFSVLLRVNTFTHWTGLCSLGVALIIIGVGRRREDFKPLVYLGIIGVSISAYELLFYQMLQVSGGALGDGLIAMSALGTTIMYAYRLLSPWLMGYLRLTPQELKGIADIHWAWSSCLLIFATILPIGVNRLVGLGTGVFLVRYAIFQGKTSPQSSLSSTWRITIDELWVYLGLLEAGLFSILLQETPVGRFFITLLPWNGAIASVAAYFLYILPWENWGWSKRPWQQAAYILPLIVLWQTALQVYPITLVLTAGYYIFLSIVGENIRFTYISVALVDWALYRWFYTSYLREALWYVTPFGLSLLYIAQVDTQLKLPEFKTVRHSLRLLGSGLICGWAILFHQNTPWIPGILSLITIFAGLALRVRAFLYIGTATFVITTIYQSVIFSLQYSFLKWVVGLLVGILLIYIAANFETRRVQITSLIRNTIDELRSWQ